MNLVQRVVWQPGHGAGRVTLFQSGRELVDSRLAVSAGNSAELVPTLPVLAAAVRAQAAPALAVKHWRDTPAPAYLSKWAAAKWPTVSLAERMLYVMRAQEQLKVREVAHNWSPQIKAYLAVAGLRTPAPWCAAYVTWCLVEAGADRRKLPTLAASTYWWYQWAKSNRYLKVDDHGRPTNNPERGDLGIWNGRGGGHIFGITGVNLNSNHDPVTVLTLEGNTNKAGSREGVAVMERTRRFRELAAYPRYGYIQITNDLGVGEVRA